MQFTHAAEQILASLFIRNNLEVWVFTGKFLKGIIVSLCAKSTRVSPALTFPVNVKEAKLPAEISVTSSRSDHISIETSLTSVSERAATRCILSPFLALPEKTLPVATVSPFGVKCTLVTYMTVGASSPH